MLAGIEFPWDVKPMIRHHHERWDGTGYPDKLAGETIPLSARILCIADVWDALVTDRPYRVAFSRERAREIMQDDVGKAFDPALFKLFIGILDQRSATPLRRRGRSRCRSTSGWRFERGAHTGSRDRGQRA